jgi:thiosulfate/3-mercaptopyruvate sulfurtransferase
MSSELFRKGASIEGVRFIDVRVGPDARAAFEREHLAGARWIDLETELAHKGDPAQGGRHPLPSTERFVAVLEAHGITADTDVVCYDDKGGANAAARLWWMLRAIGHRRVRVLDGGLATALAAGWPTERGAMRAVETSRYERSSDRARALEEGTEDFPVVSIERVKRALEAKSETVIDVRDAFRYRGESEPIDPIAGRIAGAINVPFVGNLREDGTFKSVDELRALYERAWSESGRRWPDGRAVIVHCGSGVTACHTLLALRECGVRGAALYVGSYSEWCRREPVARG